MRWHVLSLVALVACRDPRSSSPPADTSPVSPSPPPPTAENDAGCATVDIARFELAMDAIPEPGAIFPKPSMVQARVGIEAHFPLFELAPLLPGDKCSLDATPTSASFRCEDGLQGEAEMRVDGDALTIISKPRRNGKPSTQRIANRCIRFEPCETPVEGRCSIGQWLGSPIDHGTACARDAGAATDVTVEIRARVGAAARVAPTAPRSLDISVQSPALGIRTPLLQLGASSFMCTPRDLPSRDAIQLGCVVDGGAIVVITVQERDGWVVISSGIGPPERHALPCGARLILQNARAVSSK